MAGGMMALDDLVAEWGGNAPLGDFKPCARYYEAMDIILYLKEDVSYRADRVDSWLTLLWHPYEERAVGVKLKGFRSLFGRLQSQARALGVEFSDDNFIPLLAALEVAVTASWGTRITAQAERDRIDSQYQTAKTIVGDVKMEAKEILIAA